jgi:hypothetical protein
MTFYYSEIEGRFVAAKCENFYVSRCIPKPTKSSVIPKPSKYAKTLKPKSQPKVASRLTNDSKVTS